MDQESKRRKAEAFSTPFRDKLTAERFVRICESGPDYLLFREDGTFTTNNMQWETGEVWQDDNTGKSWGTWYVTKYNSFMNLYWNKPPCQMTLVYNNGKVLMRGPGISDQGFSLTDVEGGGGYVPAKEEVELTEDHG